MYKIILTSIIIFVSQKNYSQTIVTTDSTSKKVDTTSRKFDERDIVFNRAEKMPEFLGGQPRWIQYLRSNLKPTTPVINGAPAGIYEVIIRFIVNRDGSLRDFVAETKYGYGMEQEVIRILKESPKWKSATQNGYSVNCYMRQPVTFSVTEK